MGPWARRWCEEADRLLTRGFSEKDPDGNNVHFGKLLLDHTNDRGPKERDLRKQKLRAAVELVHTTSPVKLPGNKSYERIYKGEISGKRYYALADDHGEVFEMVTYRRNG